MARLSVQVANEALHRIVLRNRQHEIDLARIKAGDQPNRTPGPRFLQSRGIPTGLPRSDGESFEARPANQPDFDLTPEEQFPEPGRITSRQKVRPNTNGLFGQLAINSPPSDQQPDASALAEFLAAQRRGI